MDKLVLCFLFAIVNIQGSVWCTLNGTGPCRTEHFLQTIQLTKPECKGRTVAVANQRCVGTCPFHYKPNVKNHLDNVCVTCRPQISKMEFKTRCGQIIEVVQFLRVSKCTCEPVDCECFSWTREELIKYGWRDYDCLTGKRGLFWKDIRWIACSSIFCTWWLFCRWLYTLQA